MSVVTSLLGAVLHRNFSQKEKLKLKKKKKFSLPSNLDTLFLKILFAYVEKYPLDQANN